MKKGWCVKSKLKYQELLHPYKFDAKLTRKVNNTNKENKTGLQHVSRTCGTNSWDFLVGLKGKL